MIVALAPEPCAWLATIEPRPDLVIAPWALPDWLGRLSLPALARRRFEHPARAMTQPGWVIVEGLVGAWAGHDVARRLGARFAMRRALDALAARRLPRDARVVIAPTGAAERLFARAAAQGAERVLVMDGPVLRRLHDDLDAAAAHHPDARFLRRFRAPARAVARQEAEWALATRVLVRGAYPRTILRAAGIAAECPNSTPAPAQPPQGRTLLLAGGGAARGGSYEALAALDRIPGATLLVVPGEGLEPANLTAHPRVRTVKTSSLDGVDAVLAPSWCEAHPAELARARALGVARITTAQCAGAGDVVVPRGDVDGLTRAITTVLASGTLDR